jgi:hypothetical protein
MTTKSPKSKASTSKVLSPLRVGNNVIIRMVTMIQTGHIEALTDLEVVLSDAAWVADTGRFHNALVSGSLNEVEPFPAPCVSGSRRNRRCDRLEPRTPEESEMTTAAVLRTGYDWSRSRSGSWSRSGSF